MIIKIDVTEMVRPGQQATILRFVFEDFDAVKRAARKLGLKPTEFMRTIVVKAARSVNADTGEY